MGTRRDALTLCRLLGFTGTTLNERLGAAGLLSQFDVALERRDEAQLRTLLAAVHVYESDATTIIERILSPDWAVVTETSKRFAPGDWVEATDIIQNVVLPLIDEADRRTERARVQIAMIKVSAGNISELRRAAQLAAIDWRDVLVAAGLADETWRQTLAAAGYGQP